MAHPSAPRSWPANSAFFLVRAKPRIERWRHRHHYGAGCAANTTLRSARSAIIGSADSTVESVVGSTPGSTRMRAPAHLDLDRTAKQPWWRGHLLRSRLCHGNAAWLACRHGAALRRDPHRHKAGRADACRCQLLSPHCEQPTNNAIATATSEILTPSSKLSATIRAFSSAVQRRRRRCPVIGRSDIAAFLCGVTPDTIEFDSRCNARRFAIFGQLTRFIRFQARRRCPDGCEIHAVSRRPDPQWRK